MGNRLPVSVFAQTSNFQERITECKLKVIFFYRSNVESEGHACVVLTLLYMQHADCVFTTKKMHMESVHIAVGSRSLAQSW
jgi:hypothetical protein